MDASDVSSYRPISNLNTISKVLERLVLARIVHHVSASQVLIQCRPHTAEVTRPRRHCLNHKRHIRRIRQPSVDSARRARSVGGLRLHRPRNVDKSYASYIRRDGKGHRLAEFIPTRQIVVRQVQRRLVQHFRRQHRHSTRIITGALSVLHLHLTAVIRSFGVNHHQYADDTQIYITATTTDLSPNVRQLEQCTSRIHTWLLQNGLQLNPRKSEAIQFTVGSERQSTANLTSVSVSGAEICTAPSVKSLGVTLDRRLTFDQHVTDVCKACYFHIRALRHVRESLPDAVAKTVACSIVSSRLDHCNSLLTGMSASNFAKLQRVQNTLARVVLRRHDHITPALVELHWLPIKHRVTFKLATIAFKVTKTERPEYLRALLNDYKPSRELRSSCRHDLSVNRIRTVVASRSFRHSAAVVWNSLPIDIRNVQTFDSFRRKLKTHLFAIAFVT